MIYFKRLMLLHLILAICLTGCILKKQPNTIVDKQSLNDVMKAVDSAFSEKYGADIHVVFMKTPVNKRYLEDFIGVIPQQYEEYAGYVSYSVTNSDALIAVKAIEGNEAEIVSGFEKRIQDLKNQYEMFPVNNSLKRAQTAKVLQLGSYIFLIVVGIDTQNSQSTESYVSDVMLAEQIIKSMFY